MVALFFTKGFLIIRELCHRDGGPGGCIQISFNMPANLWTGIHSGDAAFKAAAEADKPIFNVLAVGSVLQPVQDARVVALGHAVTVGREFLVLEAPPYATSLRSRRSASTR